MRRTEYSHSDRARRANGATQTFRRSSHATTHSGSNQAHSRDPSGPLPASSTNPGVYVPPHAQSGRNGSSVEARYSRDQLIQLFQRQRESDDIKDGLTSLYVGSWEPSISNGISGGTWGRRDDHSSQGPGGVDLCWDKDGSVYPLSLSEMTEEEKEVCLLSVELYCYMSDAKICVELHQLSQLTAQTTCADEQRWDTEGGVISPQNIHLSGCWCVVWLGVAHDRPTWQSTP